VPEPLPEPVALPEPVPELEPVLAAVPTPVAPVETAPVEPAVVESHPPALPAIELVPEYYSRVELPAIELVPESCRPQMVELGGAAPLGGIVPLYMAPTGPESFGAIGAIAPPPSLHETLMAQARLSDSIPSSANQTPRSIHSTPRSYVGGAAMAAPAPAPEAEVVIESLKHMTVAQMSNEEIEAELWARLGKDAMPEGGYPVGYPVPPPPIMHMAPVSASKPEAKAPKEETGTKESSVENMSTAEIEAELFYRHMISMGIPPGAAPPPPPPPPPPPFAAPPRPYQESFTATGLPLGDVSGRTAQLSAIEAQLAHMKGEAPPPLPATIEEGGKKEDANGMFLPPPPPPPPMGMYPGAMVSPFGIPAPGIVPYTGMSPMGPVRPVGGLIASRIAETAFEREETARRLAEHRHLILTGQLEPTSSN